MKKQKSPKIKKHIFHRFIVYVRSLFHKIKNNKIIFLNFTGEYDCNLKAICDEIIKQNLNYDLVWATFNDSSLSDFPKSIRKVTKGSRKFYRELASAKVIFDNEVGLSFLYYTKKKKQILIETWHGSLGIKKFGYGANNDYNWFYNAELESKMTDFIISNSDFEDQVYRTTFWKNTPIWKYGHPRNDIFFNYSKDFIDDLKKKICDKYNIDYSCKLCLYAPTFRDEKKDNLFNLDYESVRKALEKRFGGKWVILTRFHVLTIRNCQIGGLPASTIDVSDYPAIQDLAAVIDCGITDYSSWICEYILSKKPGFTYAPDVEEYSTFERQLFFKLDELPFPTSSNISSLIENILNFQEMDYINKCDKFLKDCVSVDDGHASERVVEQLKKMIKTKDYK